MTQSATANLPRQYTRLKGIEIYRNAKLFRHKAQYYDSIYAEGKLTSTAINRREKMFMISSNDVIHNWGIARCYRSSLRMKMDAYPGRLNVAFIDRARLKSKKASTIFKILFRAL